MTRLRVVPPPLSGGDAVEAPAMIEIEGEPEVVALATSTLGLGLERDGERSRLWLQRADIQRLAAELSRRGAGVAVELERYLAPVTRWQLRGAELDVSTPRIMGILNLTDDSFSGDGVGRDIAAAVRHAEQLRTAGADVIDVGAESARADRPVADAATEAETLGRVVAALSREGFIVSAALPAGPAPRRQRRRSAPGTC